MVEELLRKLKDYKADVRGITSRFMGDWEFYNDCLSELLNDSSLELIGDMLQKKDYKEAFEKTHELKGTTGNLGLTSLFQCVTNLTEKLRVKDYKDIDEIYSKAVEEMRNVKDFFV